MSDTIEVGVRTELVWANSGIWVGASFLQHERDIPDTITGEDRAKLTRFIQERRELDDSCEIRGLHGGIVGVRFRDGLFEYCDPGEFDGWLCPTTHISDWSVNLRTWFERNRAREKASKRVEFEALGREIIDLLRGERRYRVTLEEVEE